MEPRQAVYEEHNARAALISGQVKRLQFGSHIFEEVHLSGRATAILGDVYTSCADMLPSLSPDHTRRGAMSMPQLTSLMLISRSQLLQMPCDMRV